MYTYRKIGGSKPPKPTNHLPAGKMAGRSATNGQSCPSAFRSWMKVRRSKYPFDRVSAYKVRESHGNLEYEGRAVASIAQYLTTKPGYGRAGILVNCTEENKAVRLKRVPNKIAYELGYNLIPAVAALTVEGVPEGEIFTFITSIKPKVDQLLDDCEAVRLATARSIQGEYGAMRQGRSEMAVLCEHALDIADQAVAFCRQHGVLH